MSTQPLASVIVPPRRAEATLSGALRSRDPRAAASAEFIANRRLDRLLRRDIQSARGAAREDLMAISRNRRVLRVDAELAYLDEEPPRAA